MPSLKVSSLLAIFIVVVLAACGQETISQAGSFKLKKLANFNQPLQVVDAGQGYLWVVEKGGKIVLFKNGRKLGTALNISSRVSSGSEQGLLGVARKGSYVYVYFTDRDGDSRLEEYRSRNHRLLPDSRRLLLAVDQPEDNHNGGSLLIGPDGYLYLGLGDGGGGGDQHGERGNGQNLNTLLGKVLRIDPRGGNPYRIPSDNPFIGKGRGEIYHYGLRNPWRMSFDRQGYLWIGDVGQNQTEEIDRFKGGGANFGWRVYEGRQLFSPGETATDAVGPVHQYSHSGGRCSVVGGRVIEDRSLTSLDGKYLFSDTCDGRLRYLRGNKEVKLGLTVPNAVSIDSDGRGRVYIASLEGPVYRLAQR